MNGWLEEREFLKSWRHIQIVLTGERDYAICVICKKKVELEMTGKTRRLVLLETARKHFYNCASKTEIAESTHFIERGEN